MAGPEMSIIMPVRNEERFIADAIRSLRREEDVHFDLIVVDDGSTDGTRAIVEAIGREDSRVRVVDGPARGVSAARNVGVREIRGPLVTFLDADDISVEGRLRRQADILHADPALMMVIGELIFVRHMGPDLLPKPGAPTRQDPGIVLGSCMMRSVLFERHGAFNETLRYGEDVDLYMRFWEAGEPIHTMSEGVCYYRRHDRNMTNDVQETQRWFLHCLRASLERRRQSGRFDLHVPEMFRRRMKAEKEYVEV